MEVDDDKFLDSILTGEKKREVKQDIGGQEEEDEVVHEINVVLSQELTSSLFVTQYPLRPVWRAYENNLLEEVRYKPGQQILEMEYRLPEEELANQKEETTIVFDASGQPVLDPAKTMLTHVVRSTVIPKKSNYLVGLYRGDVLHVTPCKGVLQMRPSFGHIDSANEVKRKKKEADLAQQVAADRSAAGIRASMEEMESDAGLKPLQFQVKKKESDKAIQMRLKSYAYLKQLELDEEYLKMEFVHRDRMDALSVFEKLVARDTMPVKASPIPSDTYLRTVNPPVIHSFANLGAQMTSESHAENVKEGYTLQLPAEGGLNALTSYGQTELTEFNARKVVLNQVPPVLSMHTIQQLDLGQQITALLNNTCVMTFASLMAYTTCKDEAKLLTEVGKYAVLIQGVWVQKTEKYYKAKMGAARNWILMTFSMADEYNPESYFLTRQRVADHCHITVEAAKTLLDPLCTLVPSRGQRLKHAPDHYFIEKELAMCMKYQRFFQKNAKSIQEALDRYNAIPGSTTGTSLLQQQQQEQQQQQTGLNMDEERMDGTMDGNSHLDGGANIDISVLAQTQLDNFLRTMLYRYGALSYAGATFLAAENRDLVPDVDELNEEIFIQEISRMARQIQKVWCFISTGDVVSDAFRTTALNLFQTQSMVARKDLTAAWRAKNSKEPSRATFTKIMNEIALNVNGSWHLKSGSGAAEEIIMDVAV